MVYREDSKGFHKKDIRTQIPITPTRALTIYKSQGQTLERVLVRVKSLKDGNPQNYKHKFGLLYTAFSRVKEICNLRITHYPKDLLSRTTISYTCEL